MYGGERLAAVLEAHGVRTLFTLCGGHISPILAAAKARGIAVVDVRDEATAVFAADATARLTGIPGVAAVTAGPGVTNALTAVQNARLAQSAVVLIGGAAPTVLKGRGALQDIDQAAVVRAHIKRVFAVRRVRDLAPALDAAFRAAQDGVPGPVFVECPVDLLYPEEVVRSWYGAASKPGASLAARATSWYLRRHLDRLFTGTESVGTGLGAAGAVTRPVAVTSTSPAPAPRDRDLARAAALLARAERPVLVVGSQAVVLAREAPRVADALGRLGLPVFLSGTARGLLGREHPLQCRHARRQALGEADVVLLAGVPCDFRLDYGRHVARGATLIAANRSARAARLNRRPTLTAAGDAGLFLAALAAHAAGPARIAPWLETLRTRDAAREREIDAAADAPGAPSEHVNALRLARALERAAGDDAVMVADGGDFVATLSYVLRPRGPLSWLDPGVFGTLGVGAGFALAAHRARPGAETWLYWGDGACGFGLAEFDTFVRHGVPVIAVVGNDAGWTQIARDQVKILGDDVGTVLARTAYHEVAAGFGAAGLLLDRDDAIDDTLARAKELAAGGRPVLVNAWLARSDFREGSLSI